MAKDNPASPGELEERLATVRDLVVKGMAQRQIVRYCVDELKWEVTDRQCRNYVYSVMQAMSEEAPSINRAAYFVRTIERLDHVYASTMKVMDYKTALSAIALLIKNLRLDMPSADFDWKKAAESAGLSPSEIFEKVVQAVASAKEAGE